MRIPHSVPIQYSAGSRCPATHRRRGGGGLVRPGGSTARWRAGRRRSALTRSGAAVYEAETTGTHVCRNCGRGSRGVALCVSQAWDGAADGRDADTWSRPRSPAATARSAGLDGSRPTARAERPSQPRAADTSRARPTPPPPRHLSLTQLEQTLQMRPIFVSSQHACPLGRRDTAHVSGRGRLRRAEAEWREPAEKREANWMGHAGWRREERTFGRMTWRY